ncbi:cell cycle checkpoint [Gymnopilus junonius]|uniref:Checkpoint protein n=1 Tax=Gymnopilus junonius TaxID=109634 RepID=A0A9P5TIT6_GYMJU|nr:cell cycle checkpoint [Gymnopilus junonius]
MRLRATISGVPTFFRIIQAIEKLQKRCIIKFTEEYMHVICNADPGEVQVWSRIKVGTLFEDYRIQSNANNEITVVLSSEAVLAALRSATEAEEVVTKLAKKNDQALLSFEIIQQTRSAQRVRVTHDVKIEVMRPTDMEKLQEPLCPKADLLILLPPLQKLRTIVERLNHMSDVMAFQADNNKRLKVSIRTESVNIETEWTNCQNPLVQDEDQEEEKPDPDKLFTVLISTKSFLKFLNSHVVSKTTIAAVCQHHCVILYVYIGDVADAGGVLTFYIPAIIDDEDR